MLRSTFAQVLSPPKPPGSTRPLCGDSSCRAKGNSELAEAQHWAGSRLPAVPSTSRSAHRDRVAPVVQGGGTERMRGPGVGAWHGFGGRKCGLGFRVCSEEGLKVRWGQATFLGTASKPLCPGECRGASPRQRLLCGRLWVSTDHLDSFYPHAAAGLSAGAFHLLPPRLRACKGLQRFQDRADDQHPERKCAPCLCPVLQSRLPPFPVCWQAKAFTVSLEASSFFVSNTTAQREPAWQLIPCGTRSAAAQLADAAVILVGVSDSFAGVSKRCSPGGVWRLLPSQSPGCGMELWQVCGARTWTLYAGLCRV